jgi:hypothetical protein
MKNRIVSLLLGLSFLCAQGACRTPGDCARSGEFACLELSFEG